MSVKKYLLAGTVGFCLSQSFSAATSPLCGQGFTNSLQLAATNPALVVAGVVMNPIGTLGPLTLAAGLGGIAVVSGRRKKPGPGPTAPDKSQ